MIYEIENEFNNNILTLNLQFFADGPGGEKTEAPSEKKKKDARDEGRVAKSNEVNTALLVIFGFLSIKIFAPYIYKRILIIFTDSYMSMSTLEDWFSRPYVHTQLVKLFSNIMLVSAPIVLTCMVIGIAANIIQVGWHPTLKPLKPKLSNLDPLKGFKNKFLSLKPWFELAKSLAKVALITIILYGSIKKEINILPSFINMSMMENMIYLGELVIGVAIKIGIIFIIIAIADYLYQRHEIMKNLKMTKYEVKEEHKMMEGNPEIKGKIKQKMREASMRRMMQDIPKADVVITNPTHYAIAIKYDQMSGGAPKVVAKGTDYMAQKIKEVAKENKVEIVENKPLARTLYAVVDIGDEVPEELYAAVAEVLAFVYQLKNAG